MIKYIALILSLFLMPLTTWANDVAINVSSMSTLPIQMDGRVRPILSISDILYQDLTGHALKQHDKAISFFAQALFDPANAADEPIIKIGNPHVQKILGIKEGQDYYALSNISQKLIKLTPKIEDWLATDPNELTDEQRDLLDLTDKIITLTQIMRSFTALLPLEIEPPDDINNELNSPYYNYLNLLSFEEEVAQKVTSFGAFSIQNLKTDDLKYVILSEQLKALQKGGQNNEALRIIPDPTSNIYYSPWDLLLSGKATPQSITLLSSWEKLAYAYRENDQTEFDQAIRDIKSKTINIQPHNTLKLWLERLYLVANPLLLSGILYALSLVAFAFSKKRTGLIIGISGTIIHGLMIATRVYILERPPVATLFESILFVGFLAVATLLGLFIKSKNYIYPMIAISLGLMLHIVGAGFTKNNDSLGLIQAVLNTNFWLTIHVLIISAGYATALITSLLSQIHLYKKTLITRSNITIFCGITLLLVTIGTILGGLWADQSWGRFWGWDPKENGALLIVLWIAWIMHGALSGHINPKMQLIGTGALSMIVALAWFGVNLLSVGLHSYGFAAGVGTWLLIFIIVQSLVLLYLGRRYDQKIAP